MRVLITGITGFVGSHLAESLLAIGHEIHGVSLSAQWDRSCSHLEQSVRLHQTTIHDDAAIEALIQSIRPDWVFHLAGYANTGKSFREPNPCWNDNLGGTRTLFESIGRTDHRPRILFVSTGLVYGDPDKPDHPLDESAVLKPASPYAASKAAAEMFAYQSTRSPGLDVIRVRLFNLIGPRQAADYSIAHFAKQIAAAEKGKQPPVIETGDLSAHRDLSDVRDMVKAFGLLMERGVSGEVYNAGSARTWQIREVLEMLRKESTIHVVIHEKIEPTRKADTSITYANTKKLRDATGWEPTYELRHTLRDILDYWRSHGD